MHYDGVAELIAQRARQLRALGSTTRISQTTFSECQWSMHNLGRTSKDDMLVGAEDTSEAEDRLSSLPCTYCSQILNSGDVEL